MNLLLHLHLVFDRIMAFMEDNIVMVVSLLVTAAFAVFSIGAGHLLVGKSLPRVEKWILSWIVFDVLTHFLLEGPFVILSLTGTVNSSSHFTSLLWKEYGKADSRWLHSDPTIVSLEVLTVAFVGVLCLVLIQAILTKAYYRHFIQITLCVCELYGGWMTFCPEWLIGSPSLNTSSFMYLWVYLFFFNFLWVVFPVALLYHSWEAMRKALSTRTTRQRGSSLVKGQVKAANSSVRDKKIK